MIVKGKYINGTTPVTFECCNCGHTWEKTPELLLGTKDRKEDLVNIGCPICRKNKVLSRTNAKEDKFIERLAQTSPTIEYVSGYVKVHEKVTVKCKNCGHVWQATPHNLLAGSGCPAEARKKIPQHQLMSQEEFEEKVHKKCPTLTITGKYCGKNEPVTYLCENGHENSAKAASLLSGKCGCRKCRNMKQ